LSRRLEWSVARLVDRRPETPTARTLLLAVDGWPGHLPGQHVDVRLTAEDGYSTQRSYSLAAPPDEDRLQLTVERLPDGEVSPFLTDELAIGDAVEVRGPIGGWFVWTAAVEEPVLLVGGGSGVVPLMAMLRARRHATGGAPFRLVYSVRTPDDVYYADELCRLGHEASSDGVEAEVLYTRLAPPGQRRPAKRIEPADLLAPAWAPSQRPRCFVCGSTDFVETVTRLLVELGHDAYNIRTERFGSTGG
jgi:ferredoxin-NADP reductase